MSSSPMLYWRWKPAVFAISTILRDGANDVPMLRCVPHSIAMGNAPDFVKAICEYVTAPLHEDGLARALAHYRLI